MEKETHNQFIKDALSVYSHARKLENENLLEEAKEKYQVAAKILVEIVQNSDKSDKKYAEYKTLAKEILSKAEACKEKMKDKTKRTMASYLLGKNVKKVVKDTNNLEETKEEFKTPLYPRPRRPTLDKKPMHTPLHVKPGAALSKSVTAPAPKKPKKITVAKEVVEKLQENIITPGTSSITFSDIKGQKEVKKAITDNIIYPLMNPDLFSGIREPSKAILLYGPPGNGKTLLAKALAGQIKRVFFNISASSLMSKFMGEGEKLMKGLFKLADEIGPSIIFFDEIDSLLSSRSDNEHEASRRMKTEFLVQFDGVGSSTSGDILIIAATNRPFDLDDAVLRRFTKRIYVGLPDSEARHAIIENLFKNEKLKLSKSEYKDVIRMTHGYSSSDLTALCKEAAMNPINDYKPEELRHLKKTEIRSVKYKDFTYAVEKIKPSYSSKKVREFIDWEKSLGK